MTKSNGDGIPTGNAFNAFSMLAQNVTSSPNPELTGSSKAKTRGGKYNIKGDEATLTPTQFDGVFASSGKIGLLRKEDVKKINISSSAVDMTFEIFETATPASEWRDAPYIHSQDSITYGIVQAAALNKRVIVYNVNDIVGFLSVTKTDPALAQLGANITDKRGKNEIINAMSVFKDDATIEQALPHAKACGGLRLHYIFQNASGTSQSHEIGKFLDWDSLKKHRADPSNLRKISAQDIITALSSAGDKTPSQLMTDLFDGARHGYALYSVANFNPEPVAFFIPPKKTPGC